MSFILNERLSDVYQEVYHLRSNFISQNLENLVIETLVKFEVSAVIINFMFKDRNLFFMAIKKTETVFQQLDNRTIPLLTNALIASENGMKFYASSTLYAENLLAIGGLYLIDTSSRNFSVQAKAELADLAEEISRQISTLDPVELELL